MPVPLLNCIPVIADSAPGCYNSGPEQIEAVITPLTGAILFAHIGGEPADVEGIMAVAKKHNLPVVEDCAQSHAAKVNGKYVGTFGDIAAFSTMFGKHFCCGGQGGLVFTKREDLYWSIRRSADRGKPFGLPAGSTNCLGSLNFNMDELGATMGRAQLKKLPMIVEKRRRVVEALKEGFRSLKSVSAPPQVSGAEPTYWFLRTRFHKEAVTCDKMTFCRALTAEGLPVNPEYRAALPHTMDWFVNRRVFGDSQYPWSSPEYKGDAKRQFPCPNVNQSMDEHFHIQVHEGWSDKEVKDALAILRKVEDAFSR
ncbi:MAG TPA: DegT/DnrJ/EryC1/StrS family aminotransferase, partial [bacterium]|nr:DegT/DnrJ/EryC1/StrS family aminotransferase [bacterium]